MENKMLALPVTCFDFYHEAEGRTQQIIWTSVTFLFTKKNDNQCRKIYSSPLHVSLDVDKVYDWKTP